MKRRHHLSLAIAIMFSTGLAAPDSSSASVAVSGVVGRAVPVVAPAASELTVIGADWQQELAQWAADQFVKAGLVLPSLVVRFHENTEGCDGWNGVFRFGGEVAEIDICRRGAKRVLLHEMGHAWATSLDQAEKDAFAKFVGGESWTSGEWLERPTEHAAEIIAWALSEGSITPSTNPAGDSGYVDHSAAFEALTGIAIPDWDGDVETTEDWGGVAG